MTYPTMYHFSFILFETRRSSLSCTLYCRLLKKIHLGYPCFVVFDPMYTQIGTTDFQASEFSSDGSAPMI